MSGSNHDVQCCMAQRQSSRLGDGIQEIKRFHLHPSLPVFSKFFSLLLSQQLGLRGLSPGIPRCDDGWSQAAVWIQFFELLIHLLCHTCVVPRRHRRWPRRRRPFRHSLDRRRRRVDSGSAFGVSRLRQGAVLFRAITAIVVIVHVVHTIIHDIVHGFVFQQTTLGHRRRSTHHRLHHAAEAAQKTPRAPGVALGRLLNILLLHGLNAGLRLSFAAPALLFESSLFLLSATLLYLRFLREFDNVLHGLHLSLHQLQLLLRCCGLPR
mmetsp:Transcript_51265/g.81948  ORF Transcript_51265/g.81948 Transcript_51265/m.81948 type:complete len:266 (+) Transcript_51265:329-1126(+)